LISPNILECLPLSDALPTATPVIKNSDILLSVGKAADIDIACKG
jgi:hypothetical protein